MCKITLEDFFLDRFKELEEKITELEKKVKLHEQAIQLTCSGIVNFKSM